jgi:hypothetical protein
MKMEQLPVFSPTKTANAPSSDSEIDIPVSDDWLDGATTIASQYDHAIQPMPGEPICGNQERH